MALYMSRPAPSVPSQNVKPFETLRSGRLPRIEDVDLAKIIGVLRRDPGRQQRQQHDHPSITSANDRNRTFEEFRDEALEGCFDLAANVARRIIGPGRISVFGVVHGHRHGCDPPRRTRGSRIE